MIPLTTGDIVQALTKFSLSSAPGPDGVPYSVWKSVNRINPAILLALLTPFILIGYHPSPLKHANRVVLDTPGKPSYDAPSSFRNIFLLQTISKIVERIVTEQLTDLARKIRPPPSQPVWLPPGSQYF